MNETRVLVLIFKGGELTPTAIAEIATTLAACSGISIENVNAVQFDGQECAELCVQKALATSSNVDFIQEKVEDAAILIGKMCQPILSNGSIDEFITEFSTQVTIAKFTGAHEKLLDAVRIIANTEPLHISKKTRETYHLTKPVIEAIIRMGRHV